MDGELWFGLMAYWKLYREIPRASHRRRSSRKELYACLALALSSWARFTRYEPCGRTCLLRISRRSEIGVWEIYFEAS